MLACLIKLCKKMKNIYVSKFLNYKSPKPIDTLSLYEYFKDDTYKSTVERIRKLSDKNEIKRLKAQLPAITVSGLFRTRSEKGLIEHSGYICIDIDGDANPAITDYGIVRDELKKIANVAFASLSVSGTGVFCLIPIKDRDKHVQHFEALRLIFESFGIIIDKACKDVSRLRGYSYDPDAYFNEDAVVFTQQVDFNKNKSISKPVKKVNYTRNINPGSLKGKGNTREKVLKIITQINSKRIDITESYPDWFQIACALANEFGEDGRDMFLLVSQNNPGYNPDAADNLFSQCLVRGYSITIGTFFHLAGTHGLK